MLKSVDILLGLSVVMLIVSMAVTLVNQAILNLLASRASNLSHGLADMLELLDADMSRKEAEIIAKKALAHPLISGKIWAWLSCLPWLYAFVQRYKYGDVIHREEFVKILLRLSVSYTSVLTALTALGNTIDSPQSQLSLEKLKQEVAKIPELAGNTEIASLIKHPGSEVTTAQYIQIKELIDKRLAPFASLIKALKENGIDDAGTTLKKVRLLALEYEKLHPELANDVRQSKALLEEASNEFLANINSNFDQVMDRVSVRFTATTKVVTFISAALVAITLQLDTVYVINRLATDDRLREALEEQAIALHKDLGNIDALDIDKLSAAAKEAKNNADKSGVQLQAAIQVLESIKNSQAEAVDKDEQAKAKTAYDTAQKADETARKRQAESEKSLQNAINDKKERTRQYLNFLATQDLIKLPGNFSEWKNNWCINSDSNSKTCNPEQASVLGVFLSILLLSLGAPFWYNVLGKVLQLRSLLAHKDDKLKEIRQTTQIPAIADSSDGS